MHNLVFPVSNLVLVFKFLSLKGLTTKILYFLSLFDKKTTFLPFSAPPNRFRKAPFYFHWAPNHLAETPFYFGGAPIHIKGSAKPLAEGAFLFWRDANSLRGGAKSFWRNAFLLFRNAKSLFGKRR